MQQRKLYLQGYNSSPYSVTATNYQLGTQQTQEEHFTSLSNSANSSKKRKKPLPGLASSERKHQKSNSMVFSNQLGQSCGGGADRHRMLVKQ